LRADIDYGTSEAKTTYGVIGVVWVYKGDTLGRGDSPGARMVEVPDEERKPRGPRRDARPVTVLTVVLRARGVTSTWSHGRE
jgi:small subunit ribosomal protein S3